MKASRSLLSILIIVFLITSFTSIALAQDIEVVPIKEKEVITMKGNVMEKEVTLLVNSFHTNQVLRYNAKTGAFIDVFASGGGLKGPNDLIFGPDGNLYVTSSETNQVLRYDGKTGKFMDIFVAEGDGKLVTPASLVFGPDGNLYISGFRSDNVVRYDGKTGAFIDVFIPLGAGGLKGATGLIFSKR